MVAVPVRIVEGVEGQELLDSSLTLAHTQLVGQAADESSLDTRTMGTLGFIGALLAVDIAARDLLAVAWWISLVSIALATMCCLAPALGISSRFSRHTDFGPDPADFYGKYESQLPLEAREQLLTDLVAAFVRNARRLRSKQTALRTSLLILAAGFVASTVAIGIDGQTTILGCA